MKEPQKNEKCNKEERILFFFLTRRLRMYLLGKRSHQTHAGWQLAEHLPGYDTHFYPQTDIKARV